MNSNPKLSYAIAAILSGSTLGFSAHATTAAETDTSESEGIAEITVTAQRRVENLQDVPISIQALTSESLKELNVTTFDEFVKYLPNVSTAGAGPGQNSIFMRGLSVGVTGQQGTGTTGPIPNVSVYLDETSGALPGRNLDVYAADLERIEVLEGPQGTLFGSGAQAGVLRYITNKPKLDVTEGDVNAGYSYTAGGDNNSNVDAMINLPLIADTLAVRGVIYNDSRGGYINNVPATFTRYQTDEGFDHQGNQLPNNSPSYNNNNEVANAINPVTYTGVRFQALYKINDDWNALLAQSYQNMNAQGVFYEQPYGPEGLHFNAVGEPIGERALPALSVTTFEPSYDKDKFENTALTVSGKVGDLKVVYAGGYLVRNVEQQQDYTNYARGVYGYYYQCAGYSKKGGAPTGFCGAPNATWQETEKNTHESHELRVSTPDDWRIRGIAGAYWEEFNIYDTTNWTYKTLPTCTPAIDTNCFNNTHPVAAPSNDPSVRNDSVAFTDDTQRTIIQRAFFGSVDVDLIPKTLVLTLGTRYYHFNEEQLGSNAFSFGCKVFATPTDYFGPCLDPDGNSLTAQNPHQSDYHGFRSRGNLSWHITDDMLVYGTWSQGFRPGGFNRGGGKNLPDATGAYQYSVPYTYAPDTLTNYELGWKTEFLNHRLQLNGAVYREVWKNTIVEFFDPQQGFGNLTFTTNGPNYQVQGVELQGIGRLGGLTLQSSMSYNKSKQTNSPYLDNNNPDSPNFGKPLLSVPNVFGITGTPLGESPLFQGNLRARYEWDVGDYHAFGQAGAQVFGRAFSSVGTVNNYPMPGWTTFDASVGVAKDAWNVQFFSQNIGNKNASTYTSTAQFITTETVLRPRIAGVKFGYKF